MRTWLLIAVVVAAGVVPLAAQEPARRAAEEAEVERLNEAAAVFAGTWDSKEDKTFFTLGAEYERRLGKRHGLAGRWNTCSTSSAGSSWGRGFKVFARERGEWVHSLVFGVWVGIGF
jgi:hypothetical protein